MSFTVNRLQHHPDISCPLEVMEGDAKRDCQWWIEDHFRYGFDAHIDGRVLIPAEAIGLEHDLDKSTLLTLLAGEGAQESHILTVWYQTDGALIRLPLRLIAAHFDEMRGPLDDLFVCHPPEPWGLSVVHDGPFSLGHPDWAFVHRIQAEDCRRRGHLTLADDQQPDEARQHQFRAVLAKNREAGQPLCHNVSIKSRGELLWLLGLLLDAVPGMSSSRVLRPAATWLGVAGRPDLRQAILRNVNLDGVHVYGADLSGADLSGANLTGAYLQLTDLSGANLTGANLYRAHCARANFTRASLRSACLNRAQMQGTVLTASDFSGAFMVGTQVDPDAVVHLEGTMTGVSRLWIDS